MSSGSPHPVPQLRCPEEITIGSREIWLEVAANVPEAAPYRYPLTLFHSLICHNLAHIFGRGDILR